MITKNKLAPVILSLFLSFVQISCNNDDDANEDQNAICEDTICTAIFIQINVSVTDMNQNPVALDSFTVTNLANGNDMTITLTDQELADAQETGLYPLTQDGILDVNQVRQVQFRGFIANQEVVSGDYTISTDCCHVGLDSGDLQLQL